MKKYFCTLALSLIILSNGFVCAQTKKSNDEIISARIDSVITLMTLDEKIGQLNQLSFGIGWGPTVKSNVPDEYKELITRRQDRIFS